MARNLVIVESPAKARTIKGFLGKDFTVVASYGHLRDLPKKEMGIEVEKNFAPHYIVPADKRARLKEIKAKLTPETVLWIATDEDREGEAIGWHLLQALKIKGKEAVKRITFHEITQGAVLAALEKPRTIDQNLVDAQQARRVLDRLVGYQLSPLLWKKIKAGLSAGRVQSVALRLIAEREAEIKAFKIEEYWQLHARLAGQSAQPFLSELIKYEDRAVVMGDAAAAQAMADKLAKAQFKVSSLVTKDVQKAPPPPFITSTLQQEAYRKLGFSVKRTMTIAQQLYEGVKLGTKAHAGLITYMRTDSTNMASTALAAAKTVIVSQYGLEYALPTPRYYKGKVKGAQEAHEAIRPVDFALLPDEADQHLEKDQAKLYRLIWRRALASQMQAARLKRQVVDIMAEAALFQAKGQKTEFPGYLRTYVESNHVAASGSNHDSAGLAANNHLYQGDQELPPLQEGEILQLQELLKSQHFTQPPARYSEASLVKKLESEGIGRPSTYAPIINTIIERGYVERQEKRLWPTEIGLVVNNFLVEHFPGIVDVAFTAQLEEELDHIAAGKEKWVEVVDGFYQPFVQQLDRKMREVKREDVLEKTGESCPECGADLIFRFGRRGKFIACSTYPACKFSKPTKEEEEKRKVLLAELGEMKCDKCGASMALKSGRFGDFFGCSAYPACKNIKSIKKDTKIACAGCGQGTLVERRTKRGRLFYGCSRYPDCDYATWKLPKEGKAPEGNGETP